MNKTLKRITNEMYEKDLDYVNIKSGNYRVVRNSKTIKHYYYGNLICYVAINTRTFGLYSCGYNKHKLTTAQLNWLDEFYKLKGYRLMVRF